MSILSNLFDDFVGFVSNIGGDSAPGTYAPGASTPGPYAPPSDSFPSFDSVGKIVGPALQIAGPLIKGTVSRTKAPEQPKFPGVPDSVKNDPRVQALVGSYGALDGTIPSIGAQQFPSVFQQSFPAMYDAAASIFAPTPAPATAAAVNNSQAILNTAAGAAPDPVTPTQVATVTTIQSDPAPQFTSSLPLSKLDIAGVTSTSKYDDLIQKYAKAEGIDPNLLRATVQQESSGRAGAIGDNGAATGLGQLHQAAASDAAGRPVTQAELQDPAKNLSLTAKHLASLVSQFTNASGEPDYAKVITAYNQGASGSKNPDVYARAQPYRDGVLKRMAHNQSYYKS